MKLASITVGSGKVRIYREDWKSGKLYMSWHCSLEFEIYRLKTQVRFECCGLKAELFFTWETCLCLKAFNWFNEPPFTILEGNFLYSNSTDRSCAKNIFTVMFKQVLEQKTGHHRLTNLTNKINHRVYFACRFIFFFLIVTNLLHVGLNNIEI